MKLDVSLDKCSNCGGELRPWSQKKVDGVTYTIDVCQKCGLGLVNPRPDANELGEFYREQGHGSANPQTVTAVLAAEKAYPNSTLDAKRIVRDLKTITGRTGRLLDVGCGYGFFTREAIKQGFAATGIEMAETERRIAAVIAGIDPVPVPLEEYQPDQPFDAILMSQVLEHSADPKQWLAKAYSMLNHGGGIAIAVPNFGSLVRRVMQAKDPFVIPPAHLNYFAPKNLSQMLEQCGFAVKKVYTVSRLPPNTISRRLRIKARPVVKVINTVQNTGPALMDRAGIGMFINIFAVKPD